MKKFIKSLMFFAVAAMTFTSCQNEIFDNDFQAEDTYTMTFVADAPQTRTSVSVEDGFAKFAWNESGEYVIFVQWSGDASNEKKSEEGVVAENKAQFGAKFKAIDGATSYNYIAVYPYENFVSQNVASDFIRAKVPAKQELTDGTFDPNADLLISKPINNVGAMGDAVVSMEFARVASIAKMTLKGIKVGEKIESVTFIWGTETKESANEGNRFVGKYEFNFEGNVTNAAFEGQNYVELTTANGISAVEDGTDIYFTCLPGAYSGTYTVVVVTDKATYKKSAVLADEKALNFTSGKVLSFGLAFGENHREAIEVKGYYRKVTSTLTDFSGEYLIVYEDGNVAFDGSKTTLDATSNTINVKIADGAIEATDVVKESAFTIAKSGNNYTIKSASGYYIGRTSTSNGLNSSTSTTYTHSITISNDGNATITSSGGPTLKFNNASDQKRFRYFKSGQQAVQLYKLDNGTTPDPEQPGQGGGETPDPEPDPEQPGQGGGELGESYSYSVTSGVWSAWNKGVACGAITWTPAKVTAEESAAVEAKDGSGRGQQFGAAKSPKTITTMTMTGTGYEGGIKSVDVSACAKSGNTVTINVTVGGVAMTSDKNSYTISGSNSSAVATAKFTSETPLTGDIVITYTLKTSGALYVSGFAVNK